MEQQYYEHLRRQQERARQQEKWRNKMHYGDSTDSRWERRQRREAARSGILDIVIGGPLTLIAKLFGG
jgi:hypothetical protein